MNKIKIDKSSIQIYIKVAFLTLISMFFITMSSGIRNNYGIMLHSIIGHTGIPLTSVSFIFAVGQFVYGLVQPLVGIIAAKKGHKYAIVSGVLIIAMGLILTPFARSMLSLFLCLGIILPTGVGILSFGVIIGTIAQKIPSKMIVTISGIVNASVGFGNIIMSPIINSLITTGGLRYGLHMLAIPILFTLPIALFLGKKDKTNTSQSVKTDRPSMTIDIGKLFKDAIKSRTYIFLTMSFFTCGFHMALIHNHLPAQFISYGFSSESAAYALSFFGVLTIVGSILSGSLCNKFQMKNVLGFFFGLRPLTVLVLIIMPKTILNMTLLTAFLGFSGAATVPPVSGIINKKFGAASISMLYGFMFVIHQVGGFSSAWLGGICFALTGSYNYILIVSIILSAAASLISFSIRTNE